LAPNICDILGTFGGLFLGLSLKQRDLEKVLNLVAGLNFL